MKEYKFVDGTNMPSDPNGTLGKLRIVLAWVYNSSRTVPSRMTLLRNTLLFMLAQIDEIDYTDLDDYGAVLDELAVLELSNANLRASIERRKEADLNKLKESITNGKDVKQEDKEKSKEQTKAKGKSNQAT